MKRAGGILIGTNNLNEFASGITGINPFYGTSKNPWDTAGAAGGQGAQAGDLLLPSQLEWFCFQ